MSLSQGVWSYGLISYQLVVATRGMRIRDSIPLCLWPFKEFSNSTDLLGGFPKSTPPHPKVKLHYFVSKLPERDCYAGDNICEASHVSQTWDLITAFNSTKSVWCLLASCSGIFRMKFNSSTCLSLQRKSDFILTASVTLWTVYELLSYHIYEEVNIMLPSPLKNILWRWMCPLRKKLRECLVWGWLCYIYSSSW